MADDVTQDSLHSALRGADDDSSPSAARILDLVEGRLFSRSATDPQTLGRYRVIERLGSGGMGVVYRAHDPELSRDVAIKQVHRHMARNEAARDRLHREARALADLSHPNVVQVYDVGNDHDSIYISMELVPGVDLRQWLEDEPRPWPRILAMFMAAGQGLVAAHDRGLVHRDFKPGNVLVGDDGRPRVVDFGLVYESEATTTTSTGRVATISVSGPRPLTETGTTMGTPAYMAPEQHRGETADARSDQYAFCMSLFEGLYGTRPFRGTSVQALARSKEQYELPPTPGRVIPRRVRTVLRRGLHPDRDQRWPSMRDLLEALERATRPRLRLGWRAGAVVIAVGGLSTAAALAIRAPQASSPAACPPAAERLAGVWDEAQAAALAQAVEASGLAYADETWERLHDRLDAYARRWGEVYDGVCAAKHDASADRVALDRRMVCLGARRDELSSLVEVLASGEGDAVRHAIGAVTGLRPVSDCEAADTELPGGTRLAATEQIGRALLEAESMGKVARFDDGLARAEPALAEATALGSEPLRARALLVTGLMYKGKGEAETAEQRLSEAALLAASIERDDLAALAAITLVDVRGAWQSRYDEALEWNRHAQASIKRLGDDPDLEARRLTAMGHLELSQGHYDDSIVAFEQGLNLHRQTFGAGHPRLASAQANLSAALVRAGRFDEALTAARNALAAGQQAFGLSHPDVGIMHSHLANAWFRQGDYARSIEHLQQALEILQSALGPEHRNVSAIAVNLAQVQQRTGRLDEAAAVYQRVLGLIAGTPNEAIVLASLAEISREREDYEQALEYARRSRELRETLFGSEDTMFLIGLLYEGLALAQVGKDEQALANFDRVRTIADEDALPPPIKVLLAAYEGRAHLHADRPQQALTGLRAALAIQESIGAEAIDRADVRFQLVKALWALGQHDEARAELAVVDRELAPLGARAEYRRRPIRAFIRDQRVGYVLDHATG